jgi:transposase-like protein
MAYDALEEFAKKWGSKYAYAIKSWRDNWDELTAYFDYPISGNCEYREKMDNANKRLGFCY